MIKAKRFLEDAKIFRAENLIADPLVSIILPTYCRGDNGLLERAILSVLNQTMKSFELIIVDDGSKDSSRSVIESYLEKDNRIIYIRNDRNSGLPALKVNQGIMEARGKYLSYQFDDDVWLETALEVLYNEIKKYEEEVLVYGKCYLDDVVYHHNGEFGFQFSKSAIINRNIIANNSVIHHRSIVDWCGMYDVHIMAKRLSDWDLWLRYSKKVPFIFVDERISIVETNRDGSLAQTSEFDSNILRIYLAEERDELLTPARIAEYDIVNPYSFTPQYLKYIYNQFILRWMLQVHYFEQEKCNERKKNVLLVAYSWNETLVEKLYSIYEMLEHECNFIYISEPELNETAIEMVDCTILINTTLNTTAQLLEKVSGIPIILYITRPLSNLGAYYNNIASEEDLRSIITKQYALSPLVITSEKYLAEEISKFSSCVYNIEEQDFADGFFSYDENPVFHRHRELQKIKAAVSAASVLSVVKDKYICCVVHSGLLGGAEHVILKHALFAKMFCINVVFIMPPRYNGEVWLLETFCEENNIPCEFASYDYFVGYDDIGSPDIYNNQSRFFIELAERYSIALYHSTTVIPAVEIAANLLSIPHIANLFHMYDEGILNRDALGIPSIQHVISDSMLYKTSWQQHLSLMPENAVCLRSCVEDDFFISCKERECKTEESTIHFAVLGALQPRKGQFKVIKAIARLLDEDYDVAVNFYGYNHFFADYRDECESFIHTKSLSSRIKLIGFVDDLVAELRKADALICASEEESLPISLLEAMAMRMCVISSPTDGIPEVIKDEKTGFLATGDTEEDIYLAIRHYLETYRNDYNKISEILDNAQKIIYEECNKFTVAKNLFDFYYKVISSYSMTQISTSIVPYSKNLTHLSTSIQEMSLSRKQASTGSTFVVQCHYDKIAGFRIASNEACDTTVRIRIFSSNNLDVCLRDITGKISANAVDVFIDSPILRTKDKDFFAHIEMQESKNIKCSLICVNN